MPILPKSTEYLQVLMVVFLDCSWLSWDAVIEKENTSYFQNEYKHVNSFY